MRNLHRSRIALGLGALLGALALAAASPGDARADHRDGRHGWDCDDHGRDHGSHYGWGRRAPRYERFVEHRWYPAPSRYGFPVRYWRPEPPRPAWGGVYTLPRPYFAWSFGY